MNRGKVAILRGYKAFTRQQTHKKTENCKKNNVCTHVARAAANEIRLFLLKKSHHFGDRRPLKNQICLIDSPAQRDSVCNDLKMRKKSNKFSDFERRQEAGIFGVKAKKT